mgnify:CR=1 FL=1
MDLSVWPGVAGGQRTGRADQGAGRRTRTAHARTGGAARLDRHAHMARTWAAAGTAARTLAHAAASRRSPSRARAAPSRPRASQPCAESSSRPPRRTRLRSGSPGGAPGSAQSRLRTIHCRAGSRRPRCACAGAAQPPARSRRGSCEARGVWGGVGDQRRASGRMSGTGGGWRGAGRARANIKAERDARSVLANAAGSARAPGLGAGEGTRGVRIAVDVATPLGQRGAEGVGVDADDGREREDAALSHPIDAVRLARALRARGAQRAERRSARRAKGRASAQGVAKGWPRGCAVVSVRSSVCGRATHAAAG